MRACARASTHPQALPYSVSVSLSMTSTIALTNATLPYAIEIAEKGIKQAARDNPEIAQGINIIEGKVTYPGVADAFALKYTPIGKVLGQKRG